MFALRLERLANRAYPGIPMRTHDNLRRAFLHNLPPAVEQRMRDYILNHESSSGSKMEYDQIVRLANKHFVECKGEHGIPSTENAPPEVINISQVKSDTRPDTWSEVVKRFTPKNPNIPQRTNPNTQSSFPKENRQSQAKSPSKKPRADNGKFCTFCGVYNHVLDECFSYNNICAYCKQKGHNRRDCQIRPPNRSQPQPILKCPYCSDGHLGKDCPNPKKPPNDQSRPQSPKRIGSPKPQRQSDQKGARPKQRTCSNCNETHEAGACSGPALN